MTRSESTLSSKHTADGVPKILSVDRKGRWLDEGLCCLIDLQVRSHCSIGYRSPKQLVLDAADKGVSMLAITDLDTVDGYRRARKAAQDNGIRLIPAVEITCLDGVAILGYGFDLETPSRLSEYLSRIKNAREDYLEELVPLLQERLTTQISLDDFQSNVHPFAIARTLLEKNDLDGQVTTPEDALRWLLELPLPVDAWTVQPRDAIRMIQEAGGLAVLARPGHHPDGERVLQTLAPCGLDGVEVIYPEQDAAYWLELAARHELLCSAGSGFRGVPGRSEQLGVEVATFPEARWVWETDRIQRLFRDSHEATRPDA